DSISGVIYQNINGYYQFTPVVNGWINKPANTDSINAAKDALNGVDPADGALWYYDDSTTNQFMLAKKVAIKIGHMIFAY
ncbi:MAG TPA: cell wall hydrolase, partial [Anaerovoracaceae bacterium]|nr:cell wall hydrolase [Anaerovoracaceae bacterium]